MASRATSARSRAGLAGDGGIRFHGGSGHAWLTVLKRFTRSRRATACAQLLAAGSHLLAARRGLIGYVRNAADRRSDLAGRAGLLHGDLGDFGNFGRRLTPLRISRKLRPVSSLSDEPSSTRLPDSLISDEILPRPGWNARPAGGPRPPLRQSPCRVRRRGQPQSRRSKPKGSSGSQFRKLPG